MHRAERCRWIGMETGLPWACTSRQTAGINGERDSVFQSVKSSHRPSSVTRNPKASRRCAPRIFTRILSGASFFIAAKGPSSQSIFSLCFAPITTGSISFRWPDDGLFQVPISRKSYQYKSPARPSHLSPLFFSQRSFKEKVCPRKRFIKTRSYPSIEAGSISFQRPNGELIPLPISRKSDQYKSPERPSHSSPLFFSQRSLKEKVCPRKRLIKTRKYWSIITGSISFRRLNGELIQLPISRKSDQ